MISINDIFNLNLLKYNSWIDGNDGKREKKVEKEKS